MSDLSLELLAQAATVDPALRPRVVALAEAALEEAEFLIHHGDPKTRNMLINKMLSVFAVQMQVKQRDEEIEQLRAALAELTAAVVGYKPEGDGESGEQMEVGVDGPG